MTCTQEIAQKQEETPALAITYMLRDKITSDACMPCATRNSAVGTVDLLIHILNGMAVDVTAGNRPDAGMPSLVHDPADFMCYTDYVRYIHAACRTMKSMPDATRKNLNATISSLQATLWRVPCH